MHANVGASGTPARNGSLIDKKGEGAGGESRDTSHD